MEIASKFAPSGAPLKPLPESRSELKFAYFHRKSENNSSLFCTILAAFSRPLRHFIMGTMGHASTHYTVATLYPFTEQETRRLEEAAGGRVRIRVCADREEFRRLLPEADIVYGELKAEELPLAGRLKWIQAAAAGVDDLEPEVLRCPIPITSYAGAFAPAIAETAFGLILALTRGISKYYVPQFLRRTMNPVGTPKSEHHTEISGRVMGIAGLGGIGRAVARIAHDGFRMRVIGTVRRVPAVKPEFVDELRESSWLPEMVPQCDVVVAAAPLTPATEKMFNEDIFRRMKRTAIFVALSRGKLFDDLALVRALQEGWIGGAALDVFPVEPPPPQHPIFDCPNVVMSAHTSGWSADRQERVVGLFAENLHRFVSGEPLLNLVDKESGY